MLTKDTIEKLKTDHPGAELHKLTVGADEIVVKSPTRAQFNAYTEAIHGATGQMARVAREAFVFGCVVHPQPAELGVLLDRRPFALNAVALKLQELGGALETVAAEKL